MACVVVAVCCTICSTAGDLPARRPAAGACHVHPYRLAECSCRACRSDPVEDFAALYHQRWRIEEPYKQQKQGLQIENFSGKSVESIRQDFFAKQVAHNLTALLAAGVQAQVDTQFQARKQQYRITTPRLCSA